MGSRWIAVSLFVVGCASSPPPTLTPAMQAQKTFNDEVYPLLMEKCSGNTTGCHAMGSVLVLNADEPVVYQNVLPYLGDYTANAPLITSHAFPNTSVPSLLDSDALAVIEDWLAQQGEASVP